ncbi:DNA primase [Streptomyces longispororuber]|uniref:DNA primase n=1 Tax=Streptomyces longispororuber TaxID=68230 RepID=UPI00210C371B|nr:DNA primase [Streptomyces longispororuber]MCQ4208463.1 DNA primase [Streptomyces longispororuber]
MNRAALGLAVGAGYVLGRTKKMKLAFAVGTMVAGKRLKLSPSALADLVSQQLANNPQFKEIADELRQDLRGVGKAASGALVERQIEGLAGRLHDRTRGVRDRIEGVVPDVDDVRDAGDRVTGLVPGRGKARDEEPDEVRDEEPYDAYDDEAPDEAEDRDGAEARDEADDAADRARDARSRTVEKKPPAKKAGAKKTAARKPVKKAPAQRVGGAKRAATKTVEGGRGRG